MRAVPGAGRLLSRGWAGLGAGRQHQGRVQGTSSPCLLWQPKPPPSRAPSATGRGWTWPGWALGKGLEGPGSERAVQLPRPRPEALGLSCVAEGRQDRSRPIRDTGPREEAAPPRPWSQTRWRLGPGHRAGQVKRASSWPLQGSSRRCPPVSPPQASWKKQQWVADLVGIQVLRTTG